MAIGPECILLGTVLTHKTEDHLQKLVARSLPSYTYLSQ